MGIGVVRETAWLGGIILQNYDKMIWLSTLAFH